MKMAFSKDIELLAPAGDFNALRAAVENGADAVYLGGKVFNARALAGNFDLNELQAALDYAHIRGVKIYLTMNTLISDDELSEAVEYAKEAWLLGIDGIIVQDIGLAGMLHKLIPGLPLHASTQMTVHNIEGVRKLESIGFKRVVLARELSLDEIKDITSNTTLEIEIFIHGALCISYSGQCLMSSIIGGRSGNRGKCAQPCRLPYKLMNNKGEIETDKRQSSRYLLSPKDLCTLNELDAILASGVKSLKIEGRMKSPEYVATVVRIYRKYIESATRGRFSCRIQDKCDRRTVPLSHQAGEPSPCHESDKDMQELAQVFNRGGFTGGYLKGKRGKELMCYEKPKNWGTFLGEVLNYEHTTGIVKLKLDGNISIGDGIEIWNDEDESPGSIITLIRSGGKNIREAGKHEIVEIGNIKGRIQKGCKVYKTSDKKLMLDARESFEGKPRTLVKLAAEALLKENAPLVLKVFDDEGNEAVAEGSITSEKALNRSLTNERLTEQIKKTGATVFEINKLSIDMDEGLSLPVSEINDVRRKALETLEQTRKQMYYGKRKREVVEKALSEIMLQRQLSRNKSRDRENKSKISLFFYESKLDVDFISLGVDRLYLPFKSLLGCNNAADVIGKCKKADMQIFIWLPIIMRSHYYKLFKEKLPELVCLGIDGILSGNIGVLEMLEDYKELKLMGDYSLNVFNEDALLEYDTIGFEGVTLSPELTLNQSCKIIQNACVQTESIVYGRLPLMNSEYCPVGCLQGDYSMKNACKGACKKGSYYLKDRMGFIFPIVCDNIDCRSMVLNSNSLFAKEALRKLNDSGIDFIRLNIWDESPDYIKEIVKLHKQLLSGADIKEFTGLIERIKAGGFTKGHFFKGV